MTSEPKLGPGREFDLVRAFLAGEDPGPSPGVRVGPGDDCAVVSGDGIALSSDMAVEGVHFRRDWAPSAAIGYRAATAALSDLAAVAASPIGLLGSLAVPEEDAGDFAVAMMAGVREAAQAVGASLLGGDLVRSPGPVVLDVTVVGETPTPILRTGARPGDEIWVTGSLGGTAAVVAALSRGDHPSEDLRRPFDRPVARVLEARWLAERGIPVAMIDLSDGLASDLGHIATASGVAITAHLDRLPLHRAACELFGAEEARMLAAAGGEDFELCFAARDGIGEEVAEAFRDQFGAPLTRIGTASQGSGVTWRCSGDVVEIPAARFRHFSYD